MSDDSNASIHMEATKFEALIDGEPTFQVAIEDRGEGKVGVTISLPVDPDRDEWVSLRLDLVTATGLTAWLGHAVRVVEGGSSEEEVAQAQAFLDDLAKNKSRHPQNRQQRRAAQRREGKGL